MAKARREMDMSWERTRSWKGQYERMLRWQNRVEVTSGTDDLNLIVDYLFAFFTTCYHLQDWVRNAEVVPQNELDTLLQQPSLKLCRDIGNISKHYDLTNPSHEFQLSMARVYMPYGGGWFGADSALVALSEGSLTTTCVA